MIIGAKNLILLVAFSICQITLASSGLHSRDNLLGGGDERPPINTLDINAKVILDKVRTGKAPTLEPAQEKAVEAAAKIENGEHLSEKELANLRENLDKPEVVEVLGHEYAEALKKALDETFVYNNLGSGGSSGGNSTENGFSSPVSTSYSPPIFPSYKNEQTPSPIANISLSPKTNTPKETSLTYNTPTTQTTPAGPQAGAAIGTQQGKIEQLTAVNPITNYNSSTGTGSFNANQTFQQQKFFETPITTNLDSEPLPLTDSRKTTVNKDQKNNRPFAVVDIEKIEQLPKTVTAVNTGASETSGFQAILGSMLGNIFESRVIFSDSDLNNFAASDTRNSATSNEPTLEESPATSETAVKGEDSFSLSSLKTWFEKFAQKDKGDTELEKVVTKKTVTPTTALALPTLPEITASKNNSNSDLSRLISSLEEDQSL